MKRKSLLEKPLAGKKHRHIELQGKWMIHNIDPNIQNVVCGTQISVTHDPLDARGLCATSFDSSIQEMIMTIACPSHWELFPGVFSQIHI